MEAVKKSNVRIAECMRPITTEPETETETESYTLTFDFRNSIRITVFVLYLYTVCFEIRNGTVTGNYLSYITVKILFLEFKPALHIIHCRLNPSMFINFKAYITKTTTVLHNPLHLFTPFYYT